MSNTSLHYMPVLGNVHPIKIERVSNYGMGILHVKYWRILCDVISLLALVFIVLSNRAGPYAGGCHLGVSFDTPLKQQV